jgi:uncharacterized protein
MSNRLLKEHSPYLLQHADNPVDWYPWGAEAFEKSRREDKPIFLSIGYSTCHWCHVMERESFENAEIASVLNEHFVPVKVDREERPDVDRVYMSAVQMMTGSGGWPMSMFLTPELAPFYGGTYYPPVERQGHPGFKTVLERIHEFWAEEKDKALESGRQLIEMLDEDRSARAAAGGGTEPGEALLDAAYQDIASSYDEANGGFGGGAKFPRPVVLTFLYRYYRRTKNADALKMALTTLMAMASGGMYDHIGGGFHRYSVDAGWRVPHFEKMLYDQALLIRAYADAYMITRDEFFARTARETIDYVLRDLRDDRGGFYSAEDADSPVPGAPPAHASEAKEGAFYVWTKAEIDSVLSPDESRIACAYYAIDGAGNAAGIDRHGEFRGANILYAPLTLAQAAAACGMSEADAGTWLRSAKEKLFQARAKRPRPFRDEKVIAAWNGLMIGALAHASGVLDEPRYADEAERAAEFLADALYDKETKTLRRLYFGAHGTGGAEAHLGDYACVIDAVLELHLARPESGGGGRWLALAETLARTQEALFWDAADGGFFETSGRDPSVLVRMKEAYDGAEPAGNSVAAMNLLRLTELTGSPLYQHQAQRTIHAFCAVADPLTYAMPLMMSAVDAWLSPGEFVCTPEGCELPGRDRSDV